MDPLAHLARQRIDDLRATADAIRLERDAATTTPATAPAVGADRAPQAPMPVLASDGCARDCEPAVRAA